MGLHCDGWDTDPFSWSWFDPPCCSAGVGRTGTFITIDCVLEQLQKKQVIDIFGTVNSIRHQRMNMVQTVVCWCR